MQKLIKCPHHVQAALFGWQSELFEHLAERQSPETLFITCSDSPINPHLLTQTDPGELLMLHNAGNLVPPYGAGLGGEAATIEFAVAGLGVKDIIVCGHSHCGAMRGLLEPTPNRDLPALTHWHSHMECTRRVVRDKYGELEPADMLNVAIQENVLTQMKHLRTHPVVAAGLAVGRLKLHGWVYKVEAGEVFAYDSRTGQFLTAVGAQ